MNRVKVNEVLQKSATLKKAAEELGCGYSTLRKFCTKNSLKCSGDPAIKYRKDLIQKAVITSNSFTDVANKLNIPNSGGSYQRLKERISQFNISTAHFINQKSRIEKLQIWLKANHKVEIKQGVRESRKKLIKLMDDVPEICNNCGLKNWLNQPIKLHIDHIDGDHGHNVKENLQYLCPNCHTQKTYPVLA